MNPGKNAASVSNGGGNELHKATQSDRVNIDFLFLQIATNKRYAGNSGWTVSEIAEKVAKDIGKIDIVVSRRESWRVSLVDVLLNGYGYDWLLNRLTLYKWVIRKRKPLFMHACLHNHLTRAHRHSGALSGQRPRGGEAPPGDLPKGMYVRV